MPSADTGVWGLPRVPSRQPLADGENLRIWVLWRGPGLPREGCDGPGGPQAPGLLLASVSFFFSLSLPPPKACSWVLLGVRLLGGWITLDVRALNNGSEPRVFLDGRHRSIVEIQRNK